MSDPEPRDELAHIAASLRAYLEWHIDSGSSGIPRRPRDLRSGKTKGATEGLEPPATPANVGIEEAVRHPPPPSNVPTSLPPGPLPPITLSEQPSGVAEPAFGPAPATGRGKSSLPPPMPPSIVEARALPVIMAAVSSCTKCVLHETRTNTVFSRGNPEAKLCFVGEAPGADEDAQGVPFVGRAGQLLDKMITAMGLDPERDVYVCNIVKCRPPGNRRPEPDEVATCIPYLHEQLAKVDPKVIVALGNTSVAALLGTKLGITKVRGSWKLYRGKIPVMPTYHPSYLLRPSPQQSEAKRQAWEDLQTVMKELGLEKPART